MALLIFPGPSHPQFMPITAKANVGRRRNDTDKMTGGGCDGPPPHIKPYMPRPRTSTRLAAKRAKYEHERALLAADLCKKCGLSPRGTNADGTRSQRCDPCKPNRAAIRSSSVRYLKNPPPRKVDEWGMADDYGYLDTPLFAVYCTTVRTLITRSKVPLSIGDMKRALGDKFSERMHMDALDAISDTIERFQAGAMSRYRPIASRVESVKGWNKQLRWNNSNRPITGNKTYPFALMDDTRRRELA